jgi:hypothetical protein
MAEFEIQQAYFRSLLGDCATLDAHLAHVNGAIQTLGALDSVLKNFDDMVSSLALWSTNEDPLLLLNNTLNQLKIVIGIYKNLSGYQPCLDLRRVLEDLHRNGEAHAELVRRKVQSLQHPAPGEVARVRAFPALYGQTLADAGE